MTIEGTELTRQFPALDSLRAIGSLAVLVTHVAFWAGAYNQYQVLGPLLARLDVGVAIFFVLSGFLLSRQWFVRAALGMDPPGLRRYLWKRVLRIWPAYLVAVVLALAFIEANSDRGPIDWLVTAAMVDIYVTNSLPDGLTQMWSLATEVAFYLVLPLLMLVATGRQRVLSTRRVSLLLMGMVATSFVWLTWLIEHLPEDRAVAQWLPAYLSWFAVGLGLAFLQVRHATGDLSARTTRTLQLMASSPGVCWALAGGLLLVASTPLGGPTVLTAAEAWQTVTKNLLYAAIGGLVVLPGAVPRSESIYERVMSARVPRRLGHISYGIFCLHLPVLHLVMWLGGYDLFTGNLLPILALTLVGSLLAAELLHRLVEMPFMRLKNLGRPHATMADAAPRTSTTR